MFRFVCNAQQVRQNSWLTKVFGYQEPHVTKLNPRIVSPLLSLNIESSMFKRYKHQITYKPYIQQCYKDHDHKNMTLRRPMSPHLTIYAPTLPAMTSIMQRATGTILTFYALLLSGGTLFLSNGVESYVSIIQSLDLSRPTLFILKILLGLPFTYHYFIGIRFCMWNLGRMLDLKSVYGTAYKAIIASVASAVFFAIL